MKKINQISEVDGLQATYGGGDYTVTVFENMEEGGYDFVFCRSNTDIAHERAYRDTLEGAETYMRDFQRDLRKWRKVQYGS